jgi:hypothetical protein
MARAPRKELGHFFGLKIDRCKPQCMDAHSGEEQHKNNMH